MSVEKLKSGLYVSNNGDYADPRTPQEQDEKQKAREDAERVNLAAKRNIAEVAAIEAKKKEGKRLTKKEKERYEEFMDLEQTARRKKEAVGRSLKAQESAPPGSVEDLLLPDERAEGARLGAIAERELAEQSQMPETEKGMLQIPEKRLMDDLNRISDPKERQAKFGKVMATFERGQKVHDSKTGHYYELLPVGKGEERELDENTELTFLVYSADGRPLVKNGTREQITVAKKLGEIRHKNWEKAKKGQLPKEGDLLMTEKGVGRILDPGEVVHGERHVVYAQDDGENGSYAVPDDRLVRYENGDIVAFKKGVLSRDEALNRWRAHESGKTLQEMGIDVSKSGEKRAPKDATRRPDPRAVRVPEKEGPNARRVEQLEGELKMYQSALADEEAIHARGGHGGLMKLNESLVKDYKKRIARLEKERNALEQKAQRGNSGQEAGKSGGWLNGLWGRLFGKKQSAEVPHEKEAGAPQEAAPGAVQPPKAKQEELSQLMVDWSDFEGKGWQGVADNLRQLEKIWDERGTVANPHIAVVDSKIRHGQAREKLANELLKNPILKDARWAKELAVRLSVPASEPKDYRAQEEKFADRREPQEQRRKLQGILGDLGLEEQDTNDKTVEKIVGFLDEYQHDSVMGTPERKANTKKAIAVIEKIGWILKENTISRNAMRKYLRAYLGLPTDSSSTPETSGRR